MKKKIILLCLSVFMFFGVSTVKAATTYYCKTGSLVGGKYCCPDSSWSLKGSMCYKSFLNTTPVVVLPLDPASTASYYVAVEKFKVLHGCDSVEESISRALFYASGSLWWGCKKNPTAAIAKTTSEGNYSEKVLTAKFEGSSAVRTCVYNSAKDVGCPVSHSGVTSTKAGYTFVGWSTTKACSTYSKERTLIKDNWTLHPCFTKDSSSSVSGFSLK